MRKVYGQTLLEEMNRQQALPVPVVKQAAQEILFIIRDGLVQDGVVKISQFGTFRLKQVSARQGINPQTREAITIPSQQKVVFTPSKALRELIQPVNQAASPLPAQENEKSAEILPAPLVSTSLDESTDSIEETDSPGKNRPQSAVSSSDNIHVTSREYEPKPMQSEAVSSTPASQPTKTEQTPEDAGSPLLEKDIDQDNLNPATADETASTATDFSIELGELPEKAPRPASKRKYFFGAAAILVLLTVAFTHYSGPTQDNRLSPEVNLAGIQSDTPDGAVQKSQPADESVTVKETKRLQPEKNSPTTKSEVKGTHEGRLHEIPPVATSAEHESSQAEIITNGVESPANKSVRQETSSTTLPGQGSFGFFFTRQTHQISHGESLWRLARRHYRDPLLWPHIFQANADTINNPNHLQEGSTIILPTLEGTPAKLSGSDRRNIAKGYYLTYLYIKETGGKEAFFALQEAKRYDKQVVKENRTRLHLSTTEALPLNQEITMPF